MTRANARELAVLVAASMTVGDEDAGAVLDRFFAPEHYETLAAEDPVFAEYPGKKQLAYIRSLVEQIAARREELDRCIGQYSHGWKTERLSRTAGTILRCALCEMRYFDDVPDAAAVNEAVELARKYDGEDGRRFVNGVLGGYLRARSARKTEGGPDAGNASEGPAEVLPAAEAEAAADTGTEA